MLSVCQDGHVRPLGSGADVLHLETSHGGAWVRLGRFDHFFQVTFVGYDKFIVFFFFSFYIKVLSHLVSVSLWRAGQRWSTTISGSPWYYSIIVWGEIVFFSQPNPNKNSNLFIIKWKVTKTLKMLPWGDRVTVYLVERDMPSQSHEGTGEEYRCIIRSHTLHLGTKEGMPQTTNLVVF